MREVGSALACRNQTNLFKYNKYSERFVLICVISRVATSVVSRRLLPATLQVHSFCHERSLFPLRSRNCSPLRTLRRLLSVAEGAIIHCQLSIVHY